MYSVYMKKDRRIATAIETPWLTRSEAARYAKVTERTIDRWRDDGLLTDGKPNSIGVVRIHRDELDRLLGQV